MKTIIDKANTRGYFNHGWLKTYHTFSFANYYNPRRIHFGALRVLNDDTVAPGEGFGMHPHKNMEVVSIPLQGYLRHGDNVQNESTITPGEIRLSGNFWLLSFKISYLCLPLFYETRTTPSCHPSGCAYRQL